MKIIEDLNWRYATKEFDSSKKVSNEDLNTILDSLILSPSSFGLQTWKFVVVEKQDLKDKLLEHSWNQKQVVDASHVIVLCRPTTFGDAEVDKFLESTASHRGQDLESLKGYGDMMKGFLSRMDEEGKAQWMKNQVYIALGNVMTVCANMRIDACPMEGFIAPKYDEVLGLADHGLTSVVVLPIGYRADSDKYATAKKVRYSQEELVIYK
ncbi:MAG: NAD(P)H-dependent oxidoreductase [Oligoflexia bacterium]|nr:NAD(P)H-dependent oxidoreductase [Oligoflexia bacterium]